MSAVARAILSSDFTKGRIKDFMLEKEVLVAMLFSILILASMLGIIYMRGHERQLTSQLQYNRQQFDDMTIAHSQLLLEQATWSQQSRVQTIAETKLNMQVPNNKNIVMVE
jgi:cell division protein FtsL